MKTILNYMNLLLTIVLLILFVSCENSEILPEKENYSAKLTENAETQQKIILAKAVMGALNESQSFRELLKKESIKMFDKDYDVLYQIIKNEKIEGDFTVRDIILKYMPNEDVLNKIEKDNPTLTFFIPELPENSFSAKSWDAKSQIPKIAIRISGSNLVSFINQDGSEYTMESKFIPGFPVIVIKDNERVISNKHTGFNTTSSRVLAANDDYNYKFISDCFDNTKNDSSDLQKRISFYNMDLKYKLAYDFYETADGWQRDYIYYDISPNNQRGQFNYNYQEHMMSFALIGDPYVIYNKLADQTNDPKYENIKNTATASSWTAGFFEFKVKTVVNSKNGLGSELVQYFAAYPEQLFVTEYVKVKKWFNTYYELSSLRLRGEIALNLPLFGWDLYNYGASIKIDLEEVDLTETTTVSESLTTKFANNFEINAVVEKVGIKFGASLETTANISVQRSFTQGNDPLGYVIVNFADDFVTQVYDIGDGRGYIYYPREYNSSYYKLVVMPVKVQ
jgi:hypothetical protein